MTHFAAVVVYKPQPGEENLSLLQVEEKMREVLVPFSENLEVDPYTDENGDTCTYNPKSKWDWYQFGGRWSLSAFVPKPNAGPHAAPDLSWTFDQAEQSTVEDAMSKAVIIRKGDVDWDKMREQRLDGLGRHYDLVIEQFATATKDLRKDTEKYTQIVARIKWLDGLEADPDGNWESRESYLARNDRWTPGGIVMDGEWYEQGEHGWFGYQEEGIGQSNWQDQVEKLMADIPDSAWLGFVDCHI